MEHYVVTIQRQFGSMGRPIAKKMSEILGIDYYDRDIVEAAAKKLDLPVSVVKKEEERATLVPHNPFVRMCFPLDDGTSDTQDDIFARSRSRRPVSSWGGVRTSSSATCQTASTSSSMPPTRRGSTTVCTAWGLVRRRQGT